MGVSQVKKEAVMTQINIRQVEGLEERLRKLEERLDKLEKQSSKYDKDTGTIILPSKE